MNKFLITGHRRTGTSYLSSILNSQNNTCCVEHNFFSNYDLSYPRNLNILNSQINSTFLYTKFKASNIKELNISDEKIINIFLNDLKNFYNVDNIGIKKTNLTLNGRRSKD